MRWLMHGEVAPAVGEALRARGDQTASPGDVGLAPGAAPGDVLRAAKRAQLDIVTNDPALVNAPHGEGADYGFNRSIVFLQLAGGEVEQDDAIGRLFQRYKRLAPGRVYTVTETRVKVRQLPGHL